MAHINESRSSTDTLDFSDAEIRSELSRLGYNDIDDEQFSEFKKDLLTLVQGEKSSSFNSQQAKQHSKPIYDSRYDRLYEPPVFSYHVPAQEKENVDSRSRLHPSAYDRREPLSSAKSNTPHHLTSDSIGKGNMAFTYEPAKSLPVKSKMADYYAPVSEPFDRPRSADGYRRTSEVDRLYDMPGEEVSHRHLDDYWYSSRNHVHTLSPPRDRYRGDDESHDVTEDSTNKLTESLNDKLNISQASQASLVKRKVSRKLSDGTSHVYEESYLKSDSDTDSLANEETNVPVRTRCRPETSFAAPTTSSAARQSRLTLARYDKSIDPVKSAVIWPEQKPVASRNVVKTDPVNRFMQYKQAWEKTKVPEEKKHKNLRWAVREQMLYKDIIYEKPQKKFVTNNYVVPTDKKRKDLRWRIRADMAAGLLPNPN